MTQIVKATLTDLVKSVRADDETYRVGTSDVDLIVRAVARRLGLTALGDRRIELDLERGYALHIEVEEKRA